MAWLFYRCWMCRFGYQLYYLYLLYFILCTAKGQWFAAGYESKILFCLKHSWEEGSDELCTCLYKLDKKNDFHVPACCIPTPSRSRKNAFPARLSSTQFGNTNISISKMFYYLVWHAFSGTPSSSLYQCSFSWAAIRLVHKDHPKLSLVWKNSGVSCMLVPWVRNWMENSEDK